MHRPARSTGELLPKFPATYLWASPAQLGQKPGGLCCKSNLEGMWWIWITVAFQVSTMALLLYTIFERTLACGGRSVFSIQKGSYRFPLWFLATHTSRGHGFNKTSGIFGSTPHAGGTSGKKCPVKTETGCEHSKRTQNPAMIIDWLGQ